MLTVTDTAKDLLQTIDRPADTVLKLQPVGERAGELGLVSGAGQPTDHIVERDGTDILHVPAEISNALDGATIDAVETTEGPRLSITPPK